MNFQYFSPFFVKGEKLKTRVSGISGRLHRGIEEITLIPLSASRALTMLLNECNGDTYTQLQETLKYSSGMTASDINEA